MQNLNYKKALKAILIGILVMTGATVILSLIFNIELEYTNPSEIPTMLWILAISIALALVTFISTQYFLDKEIEPSFSHGLSLGALVMILGLITDLLLFLPYKGGLGNFLQYFKLPQFWLTNLCILLVPAFVGKVINKK